MVISVLHPLSVHTKVCSKEIFSIHWKIEASAWQNTWFMSVSISTIILEAAETLVRIFIFQWARKFHLINHLSGNCSKKLFCWWQDFLLLPPLTNIYVMKTTVMFISYLSNSQFSQMFILFGMVVYLSRKAYWPDRPEYHCICWGNFQMQRKKTTGLNDILSYVFIR